MENINGFWYPQSKYLHHEPRWRMLAETLDEVWPHVKSWNVALDCGAYAGYWAYQMAQRFQYVYAFEPIKENRRCLERNVPDNVTVLPAAVSDERKLVMMKLKGAHYGEVDEKGDIRVAAWSIDSMGLMDVGFIKLDVEGQEPEALDGARETLEKCKPVVCIETKFRRDEIAPRLKEAGYHLVYHNNPDEIWIC